MSDELMLLLTVLLMIYPFYWVYKKYIDVSYAKKWREDKERLAAVKKRRAYAKKRKKIRDY
jgi:hypothetical protein